MCLYDCFLPFIFHSSRLLVFQLVSYIFHSRMFSLSVVYWSSGSVHTSFYFHFGKVRKEKNLYITNIYISNQKLCFHIRTGAYRGIEKGGGRDMKNAVTTARRPVGPSLRRDGVQGKGCALPLGKKILKNQLS